MATNTESLHVIFPIYHVNGKLMFHMSSLLQSRSSAFEIMHKSIQLTWISPGKVTNRLYIEQCSDFITQNTGYIASYTARSIYAVKRNIVSAHFEIKFALKLKVCEVKLYKERKNLYKTLRSVFQPSIKQQITHS